MKSPGWFGATHAQSELRGVAYFSMEFGLAEALPIYSGGLGILAGDHLKSASDLNVPVIGIGLLYQQGYFRQVLADDGWQLEAFPFNDPGSLPIRPVLDADGRWPRVGLELPGRTLILRVWNARVGKVNLYLLDSNHPLNSPWDRGITANLYAAGKEKRLLQELVLGVGGWRLLEMLGMDVQVCHLNEGHAAFAVLARAVSFAEKNKVPFQVALRATRAGNVFTTHTPVAAAFDRFEPGLLTKTAEPLVRATGLSDEAFLGLGRRDPADAGEPFNMAYLAMRGSCHVNGVARLHGKVSRRLFEVLFPGWPEEQIPVSSVTNGIHIPTWHSEPANLLWSAAYGVEGPWLGNVGAAAKGIQRVTDERLWDYRAEARKTLVDYVRVRLQRQFRDAMPRKRPSTRRSTCWTPIASRSVSPADSPSTSDPTSCWTTRSDSAASSAIRSGRCRSSSPARPIRTTRGARPWSSGWSSSRGGTTSATTSCSWRTTTWCWPRILRRGLTSGSITPAARPRPVARAA